MFKKRTGRWVSNGPFFNLYVVCCYSASFSAASFSAGASSGVKSVMPALIKMLYQESSFLMSLG